MSLHLPLFSLILLSKWIVIISLGLYSVYSVMCSRSESVIVGWCFLMDLEGGWSYMILAL
jgi:hypothetical protein